MQTDQNENRIIWVIGAMERLSWLGYFKAIGYIVSQDDIDLYYDLDDAREYLFDYDEQIMSYLEGVFYGKNMSPTTMHEIYTLLVTYKNDRNRVFSYGMNHLVGAI
jgi:hypothetical protein